MSFGDWRRIGSKRAREDAETKISRPLALATKRIQQDVNAPRARWAIESGHINVVGLATA
jgi:hypothetical protein